MGKASRRRRYKDEALANKDCTSNQEQKRLDAEQFNEAYEESKKPVPPSPKRTRSDQRRRNKAAMLLGIGTTLGASVTHGY